MSAIESFQALKSSFLNLTMKVSGCGGSSLLILLLWPVWSLGLKIDLSVGTIQGRIEKTSDGSKNYASFSAVPYAEPPVDKLRFKVSKGHFMSEIQVCFF